MNYRPYALKSNLHYSINQTIMVHIMKMVKQNQEDWDFHLDAVLMGYRSSYQESLRTSPAQVLYNRRLSLAVDCLFNEGETSQSEVIKEWDDIPHEAINARKAECKDRRVRERAVSNIRNAQERQKRIYSTKHRGQQYNVGDLVYMRNNKWKKHAGSYRWIGPYIVSDLGSKGKCRLINIRAWKELACEVPAVQLKRYISTECTQKTASASRKEIFHA
ncbi:hypothetical protein D918_08357 [Trichuris suis]|nr:hypothetical protein D918_08357 [Trichuris suis]